METLALKINSNDEFEIIRQKNVNVNFYIYSDICEPFVNGYLSYCIVRGTSTH